MREFNAFIAAVLLSIASSACGVSSDATPSFPASPGCYDDSGYEALCKQYSNVMTLADYEQIESNCRGNEDSDRTFKPRGCDGKWAATCTYSPNFSVHYYSVSEMGKVVCDGENGVWSEP